MHLYSGNFCSCLHSTAADVCYMAVLQGHGEYTEIPEEKDFFDVPKKSENVVCHFYRDDFFRCKIVDKHLAILAKKHMETKFVKINAEKCPFLTREFDRCLFD